MNKPQIRLFDRNFAHATSCSNGDLKIYPSHFEWYRGEEDRDVAVFVDAEGSRAPFIQSKIKIWLLLEPPTISPNLYRMACRQSIQDQFDYIFTYDKTLCNLSPKCVFYPLGGCWIRPEDRSLHYKTKDISIIASEKNYTIGHRLRHEIIRKVGASVDVYGRGYRFVPDKLDALKDYRYTIVIENCSIDNYFSEKLIDALVTGTVPLYYGAPKISELFDPNAILSFSDYNSFTQQLHNILQEGTDSHYTRLMPSIQTNFGIAKNFVNTEDWLWENYLKHYV